MVKDLKDDPFLEKRLIQIISNVLASRPANPINDSEQKIVLKKKELIEIDNFLKNKFKTTIIEFLRKASDYITVRLALDFLFYGIKKSLLDTCVEIINEIADKKVSLDAKGLASVLKESENYPVGWAVVLAGEYAEETRNEKEKRLEEPTPLIIKDFN